MIGIAPQRSLFGLIFTPENFVSRPGQSGMKLVAEAGDGDQEAWNPHYNQLQYIFYAYFYVSCGT